ncbi:hypothetical protein [Streptomyces violascens]|uniref:hypothetical protein n=1 Tax=Streptomyces violascens TaxID=67381 RepID=UPI00367FE913
MPRHAVRLVLYLIDDEAGHTMTGHDERELTLHICTYCDESGASCCVRMVGAAETGTRFEFGHPGCAADNGVRPLFLVTDSGAERTS